MDLLSLTEACPSCEPGSDGPPQVRLSLGMGGVLEYPICEPVRMIVTDFLGVKLSLGLGGGLEHHICPGAELQA